MTERETITMQPGDTLVMGDDGAVVLTRPGAPVRQVYGERTFRALTANWPGKPARPDLVIVRPATPLTPDQRDALTALHDMVAGDAESLAMAGRDAALADYAGQIAARLGKILGS